MRVVCTICTDPIQEDFCAAPCGHTFHHECLTQWLAHQKSCPQCREKCLPRSVIKLYTNTSDLTQVSAGSMEPQEMREKLALQETLMSHKHKALEEARTSLDSIQKEMGAWQAQHKEMHKKLKAERSVSEVLRRELSSMHSEMEEAKKASKEMEKMQDRLTKLEGVETVLKGSRDDVNVLLTTHKSNNCLATLVIALKRDYEILKKKRATLLGDKSKQTEETNRLKRQLSKQDKELKLYQEQVSTLVISRLFYMLSTLYVAEVSSKETRGTFTSLTGPFASAGILLSFFTNFGFAKFTQGWRVSIAVVAMSSLLYSFGMMFLPHSPRYLAQVHVSV